MVSVSMQHWNNHQLCAIDIETTGLDPNWHEICQICILPLDANCDIRKDILPFYIDLKPDSPERISPEARRKNKISLERLNRGFDQEKAKDLLDHWIEKLDLAYTQYGNRKRIIPLGQGYAFDRAFLQSWLGVHRYAEIFDSRFRDTQVIASYLDDLANMHAEKVPFGKHNLSWLAKKLGVELNNAHDAMADCVATAAVYKKMINRALLV